MHINLKIKKIREIKELSQEYVASKLGMTQATYSKLENNEEKLTISKIKDIAKVLEIDPMELINFDEKMIFHNCKNNGTFGSNSSYYAYSENERELYEARILHLEKEVEFLRVLIKE